MAGEGLGVKRKGFTLIELIVVIGIIGVLMAIVIIAVNPARQFAKSRNTQRYSDTRELFSALSQYAAANNGALPAGISLLPKAVCDGRVATCSSSAVDLGTPLVPTYLSVIPKDPNGGTGADTKYSVYLNDQNRVVVTAQSAELNEVIAIGEDQFTPKQLSGLVVWLKADSITAANNSQVSSWSDSSGNGNTASQSTVSRQPVYISAAVNSRPALRFNGVNQLIISNSSSTQLSQDLSIFIAFNVTQLGVRQDLLTRAHNAEFRIGYIVESSPYGVLWFHGNGSSFVQSTLRSALTTGWKTLSIIRDNTSKRYTSYLNGQSPQISSYSLAPAATTNVLTVGGRANGSSESLRGDMAEVIIYNRALSDSDRTKVEAYLSQKYGL